MKRLSLGIVCIVVVLLAMGGLTRAPQLGSISAVAATAAPTDSPTMEASGEVAGDSVFFDDFQYKDSDDPLWTDHGWITRTEAGWPGIPGAIWEKDNVAFIANPDLKGDHLLQMTSSTDGKTVKQTQVCQQRKFFEGTYATRVKFNDNPADKGGGDQVVETFYTISPLKADLDPDYSEIDFEYLANGGWGDTVSVFHMTTWETYRPEPNWLADNKNDHTFGSKEGWHTLVIQVGNGDVRYYVDGRMEALHSGKYYPEVPMSMNYNLWFIRDGQVDSTELRKYTEQIDWLYFVADKLLSPEEVTAQVESMRKASTPFTDNVPAENPPLDPGCNS